MMSADERMQTVRDVVKQTNKYARRLQPQDVISISYMALVLPIGYLIQIFYVLSFYQAVFTDGWYLCVGLLSIGAVNVYANLFALIKVGANGKTAPLPTVQKADMRYCPTCCLNVPPRAYHCPGTFKYGVQRYYVAGIVNLWMLLAIFTILDWHYITLIIPKLKGIHSWQVMVPHVALATGFFTISQFASVFFFVSTFTSFLFVTYLVAAQAFCIYRGQTRMEYLMDIVAYNNGMRENLCQTLGTRWPLVFISPLMPSPLPSNGLSFKHSETTSVNKNSKWL